MLAYTHTIIAVLFHSHHPKMHP